MSLIHELENNDTLLLLYLTDELPVEDRAEVEQMLAHDAGMRSSLAQIRAEYEGAIGMLAKLDADRMAEPAENHAIRQATRAMRQWQVDRLARQPMVLPTPRIRVPVWAYPIGVAAMLLIGALIWWGGQPDLPATLPKAGSPDSTVIASDDAANARLLENSLTDTHAGIADAESQANSLIARSDNDSVASSIFLTDQNQ